jgi:signal transduction histidine kinase/ligand-binding sensor domain-containing protein
MRNIYNLFKIRHSKTTVIFLKFIFLSFACSYAQEFNFSFRNLSINEGLSSNSVSSIYQDSKGRIWIGTLDGLNMFDGSKFVVYRQNPKKLNEITNNQINSIIEDPAGRLWLATNASVSIYYPEYNFFYNLNSLIKSGDTINNNILNLSIENKNVIWMSSTSGLYRLNYKTMHMKQYKINTNYPDSLQSAVMTVFADSKNNLWIGTETQGLYMFDKKNERFKKFIPNNNKNEIDEVNTVRSILEDSKGFLWVGTDLYLGQYDYKTKKYKKHFYDPKNPKGPLKGMSKVVFEDNRNRLWVSFQYGLTFFDREKNEFVKVKKIENNPKSIAGDEVWHIMQDNNGNVWFGFLNNGISIFNYGLSQFEWKKHETENPNSLMGNSIISLCEDKEKNIWIGVDHKGLDYFNSKTKTFTHFKNDPFNKNSLSSNAVNSIDIDHQGILWIGTWGGGLNRFDPIKNTFTHYLPNQNNPYSISGIHIWKALEDKYHNIIVATHQEGLNYYVQKDNKFYSYKNDPDKPTSISINSINCIIRDKNDNIYIGTGNGINKLNYTDFSFKRYMSNKGMYLNDIYYDNRGTIWAGGSGLFALDLKTEKYINLIENTDLSLLLGILEDSKGNLWVSVANKGILKVNIAEKKILQLFTTKDGLPTVAFNKRACIKLSDGKMMFGTNDGLIIFHPDSLNSNIPEPKIIFTDFQIFNNPVKNGEKGSPLKKHITYTDTIVLTHDQSVFSIYFSALNYLAPDRNNYAYIMEGFEKKWNYVGSKHEATYTNLDPGKYTFRVKISVNTDVWSENEAILKIIVLPPFYMTWWFRTFSILLIVFIFFTIYYVRLTQIRNANIQLKKMVDQRTEELALKNETLLLQTKELKETNNLLSERQEEIEHKNIMLINQAQQLNETNTLLEERQEEIEQKNIILTKQTEKLNKTNILLEERQTEIEQKNEILMHQAEALNETNTLLEERQMQIEEQAEELMMQKEELQKQRDNLNELNITKDKLFSILGHDLRSPFNTIFGYSELLYNNLRRYPIEKIELQVNIIKDAAQNTFALLNNLLEWSRSQRGIIKVEFEELLISEIVNNELKVLVQQATRKDIKIKFQENGAEVPVQADSNMISTVIRNLVTNAIKFSNKNNSILIVNTYENDTFTFSVSDVGIGISSEKIDSIFKVNLNNSIKGTAGEKGTGLGLLLCVDFIEKHKGKLWAESELGKGSTFSFSIPIKSSF